MRELQCFLLAAGERNHNAFALEASLHGKQVELVGPGEEISLTPDEESRLEKAQAAAIARKQSEMRTERG